MNVTVLYGGPGAERDVSLQSGRAVYEALRRVGHHAELRDITPTDLSALNGVGDLVFIALHGEFGEDGTLQAELTRRGIRYTGSDAKSSALAMDKVAAKERFLEKGIPTPRYEVVSPSETEGIAPSFPLPAVAKPIRSGSSVDTYICRDREKLRTALERVTSLYKDCLLEEYIDGPELTVGILGEEALPVCEIRTRREFYDYQAKYVDDDTQYLFDLDLPASLLRRVQELSVSAHRALGCRHFSRVDWRVDRTTFAAYILEINTIPGFTSHSLLPKAAGRVGISFDGLCQKIVELAMETPSLEGGPRNKETRAMAKP